MVDVVVGEDRPDLGGNIRHGDSSTWCPLLWRYLVERFAIRSVLDVGCGEGHAVSFFHSALGLVAHGIDGLPINIQRAVFPIALHDILASDYVMPVDLVWSCEVAEHIAVEKVDNYVRTLANGRVVAMTHAVPGQVGYHHVNLQPAEFWIEKMRALGYQLAENNQHFRDLSQKDVTWNYFGQTGLLFLRR